MTVQETTYSTFLHFSAGLRSTQDEEGAVRFWPIGKNQGVEVTSFPDGKFGEIVANADLRCIGNEERVWSSGYEDRYWNPALVPNLGANIADWPGHDWAALGNAHRERNEDNPSRLSSAAGFHLMGASRRLMHISEWYHQMLLYAHLEGFHDRMAFSNSDHTNFLVDCHSFLNEAGSARDHISAYAANAIAGLAGVGTLTKLAKRSSELPDGLKAIVAEAWQESTDKLTLKHIGRYRDEIVHERPIAALSKGLFETQSFDLGLDHPILGVKFDIQVWPDKKADVKFDALRQFHAMLRVLYEFGRAVISLAPIKPQAPTIIGGRGGVKVTPIPTRRIPFP
ncbi:MAG: hypothetical protein KJ872_06415 [Alphaproteobacteria bacterium]|nr:hypothetical protein [Alphaproteobacteria bacterium]